MPYVTMHKALECINKNGIIFSLAWNSRLTVYCNLIGQIITTMVQIYLDPTYNQMKGIVLLYKA